MSCCARCLAGPIPDNINTWGATVLEGPGVTLSDGLTERVLEGHDSFVRSATLNRDTP